MENSGQCALSEEVVRQLAEHVSVIRALEDQCAEAIAILAEIMIRTIVAGNKILIMGNGGSAADAQHFAAEIVGRFKLERAAWPAIALTTDSSILTAIGNDYGFTRIFSRQVEALASAGDLVIGISTSGNSENVHAALTIAHEKKCLTAALLGRDGGTLRTIADYPLVVPSFNTPRIQECHGAVIHILCDLVERALVSRQ